MVQSDTLSQRPDHGIDESTGREEQTLLPDNMFINFLDIDLQEWILNSSDKMTDIKTTLETIMKEGPMNLQNDIANSHNNRRHTEQKHTPFELILGDNPISIPVTFQHTEYLNIEEKMKCMIQEREEDLAAHKLARTRMANQKQSIFVPFEKGQKVWLDT